MKYDFETFLDRKGKDAIAWDRVPQADASGGFHSVPVDKADIEAGFSPLPMWVADMNFPVFPGVTQALKERISHPSFGYFDPRNEYISGIQWWHKVRKNMDVEKENIGYENGVLGGVISAMHVLCEPGGSVLVHSPTYIGFTKALTNNGYHIVHSPLVQDEKGIWRMDLADMEKKIQDNRIHVMILCSPHNPLGRVWERRELEAMAALCEKYDVKVIADEIWSDIVRPGYTHVCTQSVNEWMKHNTVAFYAPSKTFSLAGLVGAYHVIYDRTLKDRMDKQASLSHYDEMNVLSMHAQIGAYTPEGAVWADELNEVIMGNVDLAVDYIRSHFPGVRVSRPEGTYMLFVDVTDWCKAHGRSLDEVLHDFVKCGVIGQDGRMFHGPCHIRLNLALPREKLEEALERLDKYVFNY